jgi:hypothetical protein
MVIAQVQPNRRSAVLGPRFIRRARRPFAKLRHKAFLPAWHHARPKVGDAFVPKEEWRQLRLGRVNGAFDQFGYGRSGAAILVDPDSGDDLGTVYEHIETVL